MSDGSDDIDETAHGVTGNVNSKAKEWVTQLRLVYGASDTDYSALTAGDNDGGSADSANFNILQTATSTPFGSKGWTDAGETYVQAVLAWAQIWKDAELNSDGYEGAYTLIETSGTADGTCTTTAAGYDLSITASDWDNTTADLSWGT